MFVPNCTVATAYNCKLLHRLVLAVSNSNSLPAVILNLKIVYGANMTKFAKRDLPHTSNSMNLEDHNSLLKNTNIILYRITWKSFHLLSYVGAHYYPNFNSIVFPSNLKL